VNAALDCMLASVGEYWIPWQLACLALDNYTVMIQGQLLRSTSGLCV